MRSTVEVDAEVVVEVVVDRCENGHEAGSDVVTLGGIALCRDCAEREVVAARELAAAVETLVAPDQVSPFPQTSAWTPQVLVDRVRLGEVAEAARNLRVAS